MISKLEPSGFQTRDGQLVVRVDLVPEPTDKCYSMHDVWVPVVGDSKYPGKMTGPFPVDQTTHKLWLNSLPHVSQLNPCRSHFMVVEPGITKDALIAEIKNFLPSNDLTTLDNLLLDPRANSREIGLRMSVKKMSPTRVATSLDLANALRDFAGINITDLSGLGSGGLPEDTAIDVGPGAANLVGTGGPDYTCIDRANSANDTGLIDTLQVWFNSNATVVNLGLFYLVSGTTYKCRSAYSWGDVASGSVQTATVGVSLAVTAGDLLGCYWDTGNIEASSLTGSGCYAAAGNKCAVDNQSLYSAWGPPFILAIYATGATTGATFIPKIIIM